MTSFDINAIGYLAQGLFSARFIIQWISSEKAGKVVAPTLFWQVSLFASFLLMIYSILAKDISILIGQVIGYYIYVRNLRLQRAWRILPTYFRIMTIAIPIIAASILIFGGEYSLIDILFHHHDTLLLTWGLIGQAVFSTRFIYQWYFSEKVKSSVLPLGFWVISIMGAVIIASYSIYLEFYPILIGHSFGIIIYSRNIVLYYNSRRNKR